MYKIGDFSKLAQISIRMLRHYDDLNLLVPEKIDESTGYRYYSADQLTVVGRIQSFKDMGFSLAKIKDILTQGDDAAGLAQLLTKQRRQVNLDAAVLTRQLILLDTMIKRLGEDDDIMTYTITTKTLPGRQVASLRQVIAQYNMEGSLWALLQQEIAAQKPQFANPPYNLAIYHDAQYREEQPDVEIQTTVVGHYTDTAHVIFKTLPDTQVASVIFQGSYEQISEVNNAVAHWVEANGYHFTDNFFNIYHVGPGDGADPTDWVTEACFPVAHNE